MPVKESLRCVGMILIGANHIIGDALGNEACAKFQTEFRRYLGDNAVLDFVIRLENAFFEFPYFLSYDKLIVLEKTEEKTSVQTHLVDKPDNVVLRVGTTASVLVMTGQGS